MTPICSANAARRSLRSRRRYAARSLRVGRVRRPPPNSPGTSWSAHCAGGGSGLFRPPWHAVRVACRPPPNTGGVRAAVAARRRVPRRRQPVGCRKGMTAKTPLSPAPLPLSAAARRGPHPLTPFREKDTRREYKPRGGVDWGREAGETAHAVVEYHFRCHAAGIAASTPRVPVRFAHTRPASGGGRLRRPTEASLRSASRFADGCAVRKPPVGFADRERQGPRQSVPPMYLRCITSVRDLDSSVS